MEVRKENPRTSTAREMMNLLWGEVQAFYKFQAPNPMNPADFEGERSGFWIARANNVAIGSIALSPLDSADTQASHGQMEGELDVMYVRPEYRGQGIAAELLRALEAFAKKNGFTRIKLRAGEPQKAAVRFYEREGFVRIESFGKWTTDPTAWCFAKEIV